MRCGCVRSLCFVVCSSLVVDCWLFGVARCLWAVCGWWSMVVDYALCVGHGCLLVVVGCLVCVVRLVRCALCVACFLLLVRCAWLVACCSFVRFGCSVCIAFCGL